MKIFGTILSLILPASLASGAVHSHSFAAVHSRAHIGQPDWSAEDEANRIAEQVTAELEEAPKMPMSLSATKAVVQKKQAPVVVVEPAANPAANVQADAANAKEAASVAKRAAKVANKVAQHSIHITTHAKKALHHALGALHDARVESEGLSKHQKDSLKKAEGRLREATKKADYGKLKELKERDAIDIKKEKMQEEMDVKAKGQKSTKECEQMREEIRRLRQELARKGGDAELDKDLVEIEGMLANCNNADSDELKAEIERLREEINKIEQQEAQNYDVAKVKVQEEQEAHDEEEKEELMRDVHMQPIHERGHVQGPPKFDAEITPVQEKGIDIDTAMPYGDLEPFGREDTAQELTESSVRESDEMVDQLERAEVAEEKRAVFRALTRLRGAAITSFDGVARSQTGNIDEYNKIHKWRKTHPLHHLADEESDVSKWAFPDNADLLQMRKRALP